jgi:hypothetical protein
LVLFDRLCPEEQAALGELCADPEFYGVLRPRAGASGTLKAVNRDTALLLLTLHAPSALPSFARGRAPGRLGRQLATLVLDGVLEVKDGDRYVSGADALALVRPSSFAGAANAIARLSEEATRYAAALDIDDAHQLSSRLYFYNRLPITPRWRRLLPNASAVLRHLSDAAGATIAKLNQTYRAVKDVSQPRPWLAWSLCDTSSAVGSYRSNFKLYVSPAMDSLRQVFVGFVDVLQAHRVRHFKIGADAGGLLRPDKFIAYFDDFEALAAAASDLSDRVGGAAPHGVPFTAEIAGDGLLSWGMDPPSAKGLVSAPEDGSWRLWVTNRLASALAGNRAETASAIPSWRLAMERLRLDGVDVDRWTPSAAIWTLQQAGR